MKEIKLTQGKVALVDDGDFEYLNQWKWCAAKKPQKGNDLFYAVRSYRCLDGKCRQKQVKMHQELCGPLPHGIMPDHIDGDGLNNQRSNLRVVTRRQNGQNRHQLKSSRYPGVSLHKLTRKWAAYIVVNGGMNHLGLFTTEESAFNAYQNAVERRGETLVQRCQNY